MYFIFSYIKIRINNIRNIFSCKTTGLSFLSPAKYDNRGNITSKNINNYTHAENITSSPK